MANTLNAAKRLTSRTGVISFILASKYTSRMAAPLLIGFLFDYVDPMWNLYLSMVCSSCMLVLLLVFFVVLLCSKKTESVRPQACDIPLEQMIPKE